MSPNYFFISVYAFIYMRSEVIPDVMDLSLFITYTGFVQKVMSVIRLKKGLLIQMVQQLKGFKIGPPPAVVGFAKFWIREVLIPNPSCVDTLRFKDIEESRHGRSLPKCPLEPWCKS